MSGRFATIQKTSDFRRRPGTPWRDEISGGDASTRGSATATSAGSPRPAIRLRAPLRRVDRHAPGHAALSPAGTEAGMTDATTPGARILVVDDNDDNRYTLTLYLELEGYADIQIAEDGEQAIARLDKEGFDVVLLDVMMPKVDGYQVLSWLKDQRRLHDLPVIMISALNEMTSVVRCIELGAVDYLLKPFNQVLLRARLGASLERKRLRDQVNAHLFAARAGAGGGPRSADEHAAAGVSPAGRGNVRWTYGASSIPRGKSAATSMISSPPGTDRSVSLSATSPAKACLRRCSWRVRRASSASRPS